MPAHAGPAWLAQQIEREALRENLPVPARLLVSGDVPAAWAGSTACTVLGAAGEWSPAVRLAATGGAL